MSRQRVLITLLFVAALIALGYFQFRHWEDFDWATFWKTTRNARPLPVAGAIAIIYFVYYLRALRWKLFLGPQGKASALQLLSPTLVGFTGLALLGRPGEFIRPYLIAKREELPVTSQLAVWMVERIFDMGSLAVLLMLDILLAPGLRRLPYFEQFRMFAFVLVGMVIGMALLMVLIRSRGEGVAEWVRTRLGRRAPHLAARVARRILAFREGLATIHGVGTFAALVGLSLAVWCLIAMGYRQVAHAYPEPLNALGVPELLILMGFSMAGSVVQLPAIGGGSQLLTIGALANVFHVPYEQAVSCGMLLWLVGFMAVVPVGIGLAHREHISLTAVAREEEQWEREQDSTS